MGPVQQGLPSMIVDADGGGILITALKSGAEC